MGSDVVSEMARLIQFSARGRQYGCFDCYGGDRLDGVSFLSRGQTGRQPQRLLCRPTFTTTKVKLECSRHRNATRLGPACGPVLGGFFRCGRCLAENGMGKKYEHSDKTAAGETTGGVTRLFRITAARVSQLRRELFERWQAFHGESVLAVA